jgi:hypothetical protein
MAQWVQPLLGVVFDGVDNTVDYQLNSLLSPTNNYYRFQAKLDAGSEQMDNASPENLRVLKLLAENLIRERENDLAKLCEILVTN